MEATPWGNASHTDLNYTDHYTKALKAAREGIVLLEHKRNVLPLKASRVAVSGPNANNSANMQGIDCHGVPPYLINPVEALGKYATTVTYSLGCPMSKNETSGFAAAAVLIRGNNRHFNAEQCGIDPFFHAISSSSINIRSNSFAETGRCGEGRRCGPGPRIGPIRRVRILFALH